MRTASEIRKEIKQLECQLKRLKEEMERIQKNCNHDFKSDHLMKICKKCDMAESLYY